MKVTVRHIIAPLIEYPFIGIDTSSKCIVYFCDFGQGICLESGSTSNQKGSWSTDWAMSCFNVFKGTITLENDL